MTRWGAFRGKGGTKYGNVPRRRGTGYERLLAIAIVAAGLPAPVLEHVFAKPRRWRFDLAQPDLMLALEIEGGIWSRGRHTRGAGYLADVEKYNAAALAGWLVLRCTPADVRSGAAVRLWQNGIRVRETR